MMFDTLPRDGDRLVLPRKLELGKYFVLEPLDMQTCPVGGEIPPILGTGPSSLNCSLIRLLTQSSYLSLVAHLILVIGDL